LVLAYLANGQSRSDDLFKFFYDADLWQALYYYDLLLYVGILLLIILAVFTKRTPKQIIWVPDVLICILRARRQNLFVRRSFSAKTSNSGIIVSIK